MAKELEAIGVTGNDAEVYIALAKTGETTAYEISKKTGIHRGNVYDCLDRLIEKGLISYITKNKIKYYQVTEPSKLLELLKEKEKALQSLAEQIVSRKKEPGVKVRIFEGKKGLAMVYRDILDTGQDYYALGATGKIYALLGFTYEMFVKQ
ncbi:MAG: helix-turn-helix domain-containing protein, partial [Candidatus Altiarchaeota archaeon]